MTFQRYNLIFLRKINRLSVFYNDTRKNYSKEAQRELLVLCDSAQMDLWSDFVCFDTKYIIYCLLFLK